ncbi:MAG: M28 family peptidase [Terriglobales bacterium]
MRKIIPLLIAICLAEPTALLARHTARRPAKAMLSALALEHPNAEAITAGELQDWLYFIASDELQGRNTPSNGLNTAALFIASHLAEWGVQPAGQPGAGPGPLAAYFQPIALQRVSYDRQQSRIEVAGRQFNFGDGFLLGRGSAPMGQSSGAMLYVGNGFWIKGQADPYQGMDVRGKFLIVAGNPPRGNALPGQEGTDWMSPADVARQRDALGIIQVPTFRYLGYWPYLAAGLDRGVVTVTAFQNSGGAPELLASPALVAAIFAGEKTDGQQIFDGGESGQLPAPFALRADKTLALTLVGRVEPLQTQNVIGIVPGTDPELKHQYVVIGAHYDHVGIGRPVNGDDIYNGADDDGSGTDANLALAEAFARGPRPKRSILFIWHAGEEKGLWGSRYFTTHPTVPLADVVTELNMDMLGRGKPAGDTDPRDAKLTGHDEIYTIGPNISSDQLGALADDVNAHFLRVTFNHFYDNTTDPQRFFYRSDHFNYARQGIPILFFFDGVHRDYHQPSDSPDKIDYVKLQNVARTVYAVAWALGEEAGRPALNAKLPPALVTAMEQAKSGQ